MRPPDARLERSGVHPDPRPVQAAVDQSAAGDECTLERTVRLSISIGADPGGALAPRDNPFAAWPSEESWSVYLEATVAVRGRPDERTGYVVDIGAIDRAVRAEVLRPDVLKRTPVSLARRMLATLPTALERPIDHVRLRLTPRYSLAMRADETDRVVVRQSFEFSASHRLHCSDLDAERNRELFGKCNNQNGHGHNYRFEVAVETSIRSDTDVPTPGLRAIEAVVRREVVDRFDHKHLNLDTAEFRDVNPSVERIAQTCFRLLDEPLSALGGRLRSVKVWETEKTCCEFPAGA